MLHSAPQPAALRRTLGLTTILCALATSPALAQGPLEQHVEALGGAERLGELRSMQRSGKVTVEAGGATFHGLFQEELDLASDQGLVAITTEAFTQRIGWVGEAGWRQHSLEGLRDVDPGELGITKVAAVPSIVASTFQQFGAAAFGEVREEMQGEIPCHRVSISGSPLQFCLHRETHLLERIAMPGVLEITFSDHRTVAGLTLAHRKRVDISIAGLVVEYVYDDTTTFDASLTSTRFAKPAAPDARELVTATYAEAQATAGAAAYAEHCASCHGPDLGGTHISPGLVGDRFDQSWRGRTADVLAFHVRRMPPEAQGASLSAETSTNVLAFLLQANGFEAGAALPAEDEDLQGLELPALEGAVFDPDAPVEPSRRQTALLAGLTPVTAEMLSSPPPEDWLSWGGASRGLSFSPLDVIDTETVSGLAPAWRTAIRPGASMSVPLVHRGIMFLQTYPDTTLALDAATGDVLWRYQRQGVASSSQKMGIALFGDRVFVPTSDLHVVALEARTGAVVWDHAIRIEIPEGGRGGHQLRSAPLIAGGQVIQGVTASFASRGGFLVAIDAETGEESWRFDTIARPGTPGGNTWNGVPMDERSGGSVWHQGTWDPELDLVYYGVAPTYDTGPLLIPSGEEGVTSDALFTNCTIALRPETGELVWYYQHMPNDQWDLDWVFERQIVELEIDGEPRKVVMNAGKIAILEALDAATGAYLFSVDPGTQNVIAAIDPETGAKTFDPERMPDPERPTVVCPSAAGGRSWPPTAYSPSTKMAYLPITEWCMTLGREGARLLTSGVGITEAVHPDTVDGKLARLQAIDVANRTLAWKHEQVAPISTGLLATAGGLVFAGDLEPSLKALDAATGAVLWRAQLDAVPSSSIISYRVGRKQYVAVLVGITNIHVESLGRAYAEFVADEGVAAEAPPKGGAAIWVFAL